ncbi:cation:dicarboxylase symporter family transporter [Gemmatimonas sp.]|uniref:dicarboxylate/amino acid:cation symporter n=1 Tax=Gemmatimonas sp. TaxID=1962908 RepID=UPI0033423342
MAHLSADTPAAAPKKKGLLGIGFTSWILISMIVGILIGWLAPDFAPNLKPFANIFLRMIKSLIVPLLFSTLVVGIAGHGDDMKKVGKLALRSIIYFEVVTTLALAIGLVAVNIAKPGVGLSISAAGDAEEFKALAAKTPTFGSVLEHTVPQSFFEAAAQNEVLQIVFFAIIFAVALARVEGPSKKFMLDWLQSLSDIMFKFVGIVMAYAPIGIGAAIGVTVGKSGLDVMINLAKLVGTLYVSLIIFVLLVLLPIAMLAKLDLKRFWKLVKEPWLIAFSTASSEAAFPQAMQAMEKFGVPRRIVSFVLPTGYSFNLDGSTLYLAIASVFVAQAAGIDMPIGTQLLMMLTLMLTSKGVAAVPRASLVILSGALAQFGLPLEGIAIILGVDAIMDMARTSVNLLGNCLATAVMARWEGVLETPKDGADAVVPA